MEAYEDYKAWLRLKKAGKLDDNQRSNLHHSSSTARAARGRHEHADPQPELNGESGFAQKLRELPARNSGLWIIPAAGVHASSFKTDFTDSDAKGRVGWNAGIDFRIRAKRFFIQPGVHYFNSSIGLTSKDSLSDAPLLSGPRLHSIKVPVLLGVYLTRATSGFFKLNIKGGASGNYLLAADQNDSKEFEKDNLETYSYGLNAGLGLEFGLLTLDLSHEWGISSVLKNSNAKNNLLRVTIGIKL